MNEDLILRIAEPFVKDGYLTYEQFDQIYSVLSLKEQYVVTEVLYQNGILLKDEESNDGEISFITDESTEDDYDAI